MHFICHFDHVIETGLGFQWHTKPFEVKTCRLLALDHRSYTEFFCTKNTSVTRLRVKQ